MSLYQTHIHLSVPVYHNLSLQATQKGQLYLATTIITTIVENLCVFMSAYASPYASMYIYFSLSLAMGRDFIELSDAYFQLHGFDL